MCFTSIIEGWGSAVGTAPREGLDVMGIISWWERGFPYSSRPTRNPLDADIFKLTEYMFCCCVSQDLFNDALVVVFL